MKTLERLIENTILASRWVLVVFYIGLAAALLVLDGLGWRLVSVLFDRERLITGTR